MKKLASTLRVSYRQLIDFFALKKDRTFQLSGDTGTGGVLVVDLEEGLQARIWDCTFTFGIEIYSTPDETFRPGFLVLACFLETAGLHMSSGTHFSSGDRQRDRLLLSAASEHALKIDPMAPVRCLSITFSHDWLCRSLQDHRELQDTLEKLDAAQSGALVPSMDAAEKALAREIITSAQQQHLGTFYLKSCTLKLVADFLKNIRAKDVALPVLSRRAVLRKVELCLQEHITQTMPRLTPIAHLFFLSESTLKRWFKKQYGTTASAYFTSKKMEYAHRLIQEHGASAADTARLVGYRSKDKFTSAYKKFYTT